VSLALRLARLIDRVNAAIGKAACGLMIALVGLGAMTAVLRYVGRPLGVSLTSNAFLEGQWYLFSAVFLLGAAWTLRENAHVRVDVLYGRLGPRGKAWTDLLGALLFLLPFCALMLWATGPSVAESWAVREVSPDPGGLPRYPIKALVPVAFVLLFLQGVAQAIKAIATLRGHNPAEGA
jgi:TRAP-type mannitol/chloroaromatic compound transport system permease small subunit